MATIVNNTLHILRVISSNPDVMVPGDIKPGNQADMVILEGDVIDISEPA